MLRKRRTAAVAVAAALALVGAIGITMVDADADEVPGDITIGFDGSIFIDGANIDVTLPGITGTASGTIAANGDLDLTTVSFPPFPIDVSGVPGTAELVPTGPWAGNLNSTTGLLTITGGANTNVSVPTIGANPCVLGPLALNFTTGSSGTATGVPYNAGTGTASVVDNTVALGQTTGSATCVDPGLTLINLGLPLPVPSGGVLGDFDVTVTIEQTTTTTAEETTTTAEETTTTQATTTTTGGPTGPTLSIADETINEPDKKPGKLTFTVSLSEPQTSTVKVKVATVDETASSVDKADYQQVKPKNISIPKGKTSKTFTVNITGDTTAEATETFRVVMTEPVGATTPDPDAVGTITDDDPILMSVADQSFVEGDKNNNALVTVTIDRPSDCTVKAKLTTSDGTASDEPGDDYKKKTNTGVTIKAGQTSGTVKITIEGDDDPEGNETFNVTLSSPTCAEIADGSAVITIEDDDGIPT